MWAQKHPTIDLPLGKFTRTFSVPWPGSHHTSTCTCTSASASTTGFAHRLRLTATGTGVRVSSLGGTGLAGTWNWQRPLPPTLPALLQLLVLLLYNQRPHNPQPIAHSPYPIAHTPPPTCFHVMPSTDYTRAYRTCRTYCTYRTYRTRLAYIHLPIIPRKPQHLLYSLASRRPVPSRQLPSLCML